MVKRKPLSFKDERSLYISSIPKNQVSFYPNYILHRTIYPIFMVVMFLKQKKFWLIMSVFWYLIFLLVYYVMTFNMYDSVYLYNPLILVFLVFSCLVLVLMILNIFRLYSAVLDLVADDGCDWFIKKTVFFFLILFKFFEKTCHVSHLL